MCVCVTKAICSFVFQQEQALSLEVVALGAHPRGIGHPRMRERLKRLLVGSGP